MQTLFMADLHLSAKTPQLLDKLADFLQQQAETTQALYILGDLFETWIGDDDTNNINQSIIDILSSFTSKGARIYFMAGNRDFLIGKRFLKQAHCQRLDDPTLIDLYGTPTLLAHGDLLCTQDHHYIKARRWLRNPWGQRLFLALPLKLRRKIAQKIRQKSQQHLSHTAASIMDVSSGEDQKLMRQYHASLLIHGHTHRPAIHQLDKDHTRIVLAAWHQQGNALICQANDQQQLTYQLVYF